MTKYTKNWCYGDMITEKRFHYDYKTGRMKDTQSNSQATKDMRILETIINNACYSYEKKIKELEQENEQLKQDIKYLEEKIKENEWHWNTIDEDRDVWHYKCNQAEERVKELKDENEQLKKENEKLHSKIFEMRTNEALERTEISKQSYDGYKTAKEFLKELEKW